MAGFTIIVDRGCGSGISHKLALDSVQYTVPKLREELENEGLMFGYDLFKDETSNNVILKGSERNFFMIDICQSEYRPDPENSKLLVKTLKSPTTIVIKPGESSTKQISVTKDGKSNAIQYDVKKTLLDFRNYLRSKDMIDKGDRFVNSDKVTFLLDEEGRTLVTQVIGAKSEVTLVKGNASSEIVVERDLKKTYTVEDITTLANFRQTLIKDQFMMAGEVFQVAGSDLTDETKRVKEIAKDGKLSIKYTPILGPVVPKSTLPPAPSTKVEWGQTVTYTKAGGANPAPTIKSSTFDGKDSDEWPMLTWEQKRYVFSLLQLGRAIVLGPTQALKGAPGDSLVKSSKNTIWLKFPTDGPDFTMPEKSFWGNFKSTFSLAVHEVHKRAATSVSGGGGVKGAALVSEFGMVEESTEHEQRTKLYNSQLFCKPVVSLFIQVEHDRAGRRPSDVEASEEFTEEIRATIEAEINDIYPDRTRYIRLLRILGKYGHYLPVEFDLGGAMGFVETIETDKQMKTTMRSFTEKGKAEATIKGVELSTGFAREDSEQDTREFQNEATTSQPFMIGGDAATFDSASPGEWLKSLKKHTYWKVIRYGNSVPTIRFLEPVLLKKCVALLKEYASDAQTAGYTSMDMMRYTLAAQSALPQDAKDDFYD